MRCQPSERRRVVKRRIIVVAICIVLVGVAIWMARSTMHDAVSALGGANGWWIVLAVGAELVSYAAMGALLRRLIAADVRLSWWTGTRLALVVFGLGGIMPASPAEGVTVATVELHRRGVGTALGAGILVLSEWVRLLTLALLFALDLVVAALNGRSLRLSLLAVIGGSAAIIVLVAAASTFVRSHRAARVASSVLNRFARRRLVDDDRDHRGDDLQATMLRVLGSRRNRLAVSGWAAVGWIADAGCLALCVRALGGELGLDAVLLAYVIASIVSLLPLLPGGLGAVEVAVPAVMAHFGVPLDIALAATFAWRGLSLLAPAVGGSLALVDLRRQRVVALVDPLPIEAQCG